MVVATMARCPLATVLKPFSLTVDIELFSITLIVRSLGILNVLRVFTKADFGRTAFYAPAASPFLDDSVTFKFLVLTYYFSKLSPKPVRFLRPL